MVEITLLLGIIGMLCVLIAFVLEEFNKRFNQETYFYNIMNIVGAGLLVYYGLTLNGWPFVILNIIWVLTAGFKLSKIMKRKKNKLKDY